MLTLTRAKGAADQSFAFKVDGKFAPQTGGYGGTVAVVASNGTALEVVAEGRGATAGFEGVTLNAESLNALNASRQVIGGQFSVLYGQRSEERRVGKEGVSTCRSRWSPYH